MPDGGHLQRVTRQLTGLTPVPELNDAEGQGWDELGCAGRQVLLGLVPDQRSAGDESELGMGEAGLLPLGFVLFAMKLRNKQGRDRREDHDSAQDSESVLVAALSREAG